jgi:4-amino-4-deoxy-L-arabinose transferase-like glycosyltransferase
VNKNRYFERSLWVVFAIFIFSNAIIAYSEVSFWIKILAGFSGVFLPFLFILLNSKNFSFKPEEIREYSLPRFAPWALALVSAFFLRFYKLTSFSCWPSTDEGWSAAYAIDLYEKWHWKLLLGYQKIPVFNYWIEAGLFKILGPSTFSFYLLPAVISFSTIFFVYAAAKEFFSKEFSFLCALIAAFSFWPLLLGRIAKEGVMVPILELTGIILLSRILKSEQENRRNLLALLLGLGLVCGFYYFFYYWISYWIWFHFFIIWLGFRQEKVRKTFKILFFTEAFLLLPFVVFFTYDGLGQYVNSLLLFNKHSVWVSGFNSLSYLTSFLWWADPSGFIYRPQWGGFLNPVSGSFFLFGLISVLIRWRDPIWRWVLFAVPFFLLPGLLSQTFEMYRIVTLVPLVILITATGFQVLFNQFPKYGKVFIAFFLISVSLDTYHLFGVYRQVWAVPGIQWRPFKSLERWRAFEILEQQNRENGPGLIFADFIIRNFDRTLDLATYAYNCDRNASLSQVKPGWVAVIFPDHLQPFLKHRFANGKWYELSGGLPVSDENSCLGIIPWSEENREVFIQWGIVNRGFREVSRQMLYSKNQMTYEEYENAVISIRPELGGDPFLESCFDQKVLGAFDTQAEPQKALYFAWRGLKYGYPSAFFIEKLSELKKLEKKD